MTKEELWTFFFFYEPLGIIILVGVFTIIFELWMKRK